MIYPVAIIAVAEVALKLEELRREHDLIIDNEIVFYGPNDPDHQRPFVTLTWSRSGQEYRICTRGQNETERSAT